ncbi:CheR family methyltransferase, partial [Magnetococcales bacterium HHB-1]
MIKNVFSFASRAKQKQIDNATLKAFLELVTQQTGLVVPKQDVEHVRLLLEERLKQHRIKQQDYLQMLQSYSAISQEEWRTLILNLTTGESYFFRDRGQMSLLEKKILPELLKGSRHRELRIWSAGCSTGEEPYTLAIQILQNIPPSDPRPILILGTDINEHALERARQGLYSSWSFRKTVPEILNTYFKEEKEGWRILPEIRQRVTFKKINLIQTAFPAPQHLLSEFDLILCRNVFIYFDGDTIQKLIQQMARTLRPGGYLMTGHAEVSRRNPAGLLTHMHAESLIYQRPTTPSTLPLQDLPPKKQPQSHPLSSFPTPS